jgi:Cd2+/Zn2+-exporting ATPase
MIKKIKMENLTCSGCAGKIEDALMKRENIHNATFNFTNQIMLLETKDDFVENKEVIEIRKIVNSIETGVDTYLPHEGPSENKKHRYYSTFFIGLILYVLINYIFPISGIYLLIGTYISYFLVAKNIIVKTIKGLRRKDFFNENTLMVIATIAAMLLGEYLEALLVVIFYSFGEYLQNYAVKSSKNEIKGLMDLKVDYANVKYQDKILLKDPNEVQVGDIIVVKNGEKIPVDGIVSKGDTDLNSSALTGESKLSSVSVGDKVLSGNINVGGVVEITAEKKYEDSTVAKIIDLIENSTNKKAKTEQFITKFSKYYTPLVTILAILMFSIPTIIYPENMYIYAYRAATFLVISCPCALVLSVPLSYFSGIGASAREGILFKGSSFLDMILHVDQVALDKTGTITKGNFAVDSYTSEETLKLAASLEKYSTHPIAKSVLAKSEDNLYKMADIIEVPGKGIKGTLDGEIVLVGNHKLLDDNQIDYDSSNEIGTIIYVAKNNEYIGNLTIKDEIKDSSYLFFNNHSNLNFTMLTGDNESTAKSVSNELGGMSYYSSLLPQEKISKFENISSNGYKMFVGDGINDAPLLKQADIGVAMGEGSELAIDVADIIIMDNDLTKLSKSFSIASKTRRIVIQNIVLTLGVKFIVLGLASLGMSSMLAAIFADVGISLIAVLNSLRIIFGKNAHVDNKYREQLFNVLSDATMLSMLDTLYQKECTLSELNKTLKKSSGFLMKKLKKLLDLKIVVKIPENGVTKFKIADNHIKSILKLAQEHKSCAMSEGV